MDLIERLEALRISDSDFFGTDRFTQLRYEAKNEMLDECLEVVYKWLREQESNT